MTQGFPLNPGLFNLLMVDLDKVLRKSDWGGVRIGKEKVYPVDIVLLAEEEDEGIWVIILRLERYLQEKKVELNIEKTKIIRFKKKRERVKKLKWKWRGNKIEKVKEYKYLSYTVKERRAGSAFKG